MTLVTVNQIDKRFKKALMLEGDIYLLKMLRGMKFDGFYLTSCAS